MGKIVIDNLKVKNNNILVEPLKKDEEALYGLVSPQQYEDRAEYGIVLKSDDQAYKKGTMVFFNKYSPTKIQLEGKEILVIRAEDIVAFL